MHLSTFQVQNEIIRFQRKLKRKNNNNNYIAYVSFLQFDNLRYLLHFKQLSPVLLHLEVKCKLFKMQTALQAVAVRCYTHAAIYLYFD